MIAGGSWSGYLEFVRDNGFLILRDMAFVLAVLGVLFIILFIKAIYPLLDGGK